MRRALISTALVTFFVAACSSSDSTDATSFNQQYCDLVAGTCCPAAGKPYNATTCTTFLAAASGAGAVYNATAGEACLSAIRAAKSSATFCSDFGSGNAALETTCKNVYSSSSPGTKNPGDQCDEDGDCAASSQGDVACEEATLNNADVQACILQLRAKLGDACEGDKVADVTTFSNVTSATIGICYEADGLYCDSATQKCAARGAIGQPCSGTEEQACVSGAHCDFASQKCAAPVALGGACSGVADECASGAYCDPNSKVCTTALAVGAACTSDDQCGQTATCTSGKCAVDANLATVILCGQ